MVLAGGGIDYEIQVDQKATYDTYQRNVRLSPFDGVTFISTVCMAPRVMVAGIIGPTLKTMYFFAFVIEPKVGLEAYKIKSSSLPPKAARHLSELKSKQTSKPEFFLGLSFCKRASMQVVATSRAFMSACSDVNTESSAMSNEIDCCGSLSLCADLRVVMNGSHDTRQV